MNKRKNLFQKNPSLYLSILYHTIDIRCPFQKDEKDKFPLLPPKGIRGKNFKTFPFLETKQNVNLSFE